MDDLAVIIPSLNDAPWLAACLPTVFARAGDLELDVVVCDLESEDGTRELVETRFPQARVITRPNRGFASCNNEALDTCDARYVLLLNADTEILEGSLAALVAAMDDRPGVGVLGVRQLDSQGAIYPTMRRFLSPWRLILEALGAERWARGLVHRVLDERAYDRDTTCDWTIGSFMLIRREALRSAGVLDERFFFYSEEEDLCRRVRQAGWDIRHVPLVTIVHHVGKGGRRPQFEAQKAYARRQYAQKHFGPAGRALVLLAQLVGDLVRLAPVGADQAGRRSRQYSARASLAVSLGLSDPPFIAPPPTAVPPRRPSP